MTLEQKYFIALNELVNSYLKLTNGSESCQILRNAVDEYVKYLKKENIDLENKLKQKEDIIDKVEDYIIKHKLFNYVYDKEELYETVTDDRARADLLEILDNKGE